MVCYIYSLWLIFWMDFKYLFMSNWCWIFVLFLNYIIYANFYGYNIDFGVKYILWLRKRERKKRNFIKYYCFTNWFQQINNKSFQWVKNGKIHCILIDNKVNRQKLKQNGLYVVDINKQRQFVLNELKREDVSNVTSSRWWCHKF